MAILQESQLDGYPLLYTPHRSGVAKLFDSPKARRRIQIERFPSLGRSIQIKGMEKGRSPQVMGIFKDPASRLHGQWWIRVCDEDTLRHIIVPSSKITIG